MHCIKIIPTNDANGACSFPENSSPLAGIEHGTSSSLLPRVHLFTGDYFCLDNPAALESNILHDLHLTEREYMGFYSWVYWPAAVTCLIGGYLIDRVFGVRVGIAVFSGLLALGQV